jgi:signal transduction histidine kinase
MSPSSRHLYPEWLRPGSGRRAATRDESSARQLDGAWRVWERLRAFDRRHAALVDVGLAVALFVLSSGWVIDRHALRPSLWFVAALTVPLVFRRRAPMTVFLVLSAVAFVQWLVTVPGLADASLLVALYTVALESEWVLVLAASLIMEIGVVMATVRWTPTANDVKSFVFLTGLAFTALLAGVVVRALRSQLDWLAERAERLEIERDQQASLAAAAERARIAREMHDVVSHNLQVMVTLADAASAAQPSNPARAAEAMHEVSSTGRQALTDMRRMLGVLRDGPPASAAVPSDAPDAPSAATAPASPNAPAAPASPAAPLTPQPGLAELDALIERVRGTGLPVELERSGPPFALTDAAGLTVYRIVQEALTNALKHADEPDRVMVHVTFDDPDVSVRVTDDGRTAVGVTGGATGNAFAGGHGVTGMAERAAAFGGHLGVGPRPGGGWEVTTTLRGCKAPVPR